MPCLFNDPKAPEGGTCLAAAEEDQFPGLVGEGQTEGVAGVAGEGSDTFAAGSERSHASPGQRDARKWLEVGTAKEVSRLMRKPGSQRGVGGEADRGGRITMGKAGLDARVGCSG